MTAAKVTRFSGCDGMPPADVGVQVQLTMPLSMALMWPDQRSLMGWDLEPHLPERWSNGVTQAFGGKPLTNLVIAHYQASMRLYQGMIQAGVISSEAALVLPQATLASFPDIRPLSTFAALVRGVGLDARFEPILQNLGEVLAEQFPLSWEKTA